MQSAKKRKERKERREAKRSRPIATRQLTEAELLDRMPTNQLKTIKRQLEHGLGVVNRVLDERAILLVTLDPQSQN